MKIISLAFKNDSSIPRLYTCQGSNLSPPLEFLELPRTAKSLALIMDDPDVPPSVREDRMWVHWVIFNMPPQTAQIEEGSTPPGIQGANTAGKNIYMGPCPPDREHRYFFKLYALDMMLNLKEGATKEELLSAMKEHILEEAVLMGKYKKSAR
jgi:Raf kinase inhibitor-like YbhB/YbcL family protein